MLQNKKYLLDIFLFEAGIELDNTTDVSSVINGDKMTCMMLCWGLRGFLLRPFQSNIKVRESRVADTVVPNERISHLIAHPGNIPGHYFRYSVDRE